MSHVAIAVWLLAAVARPTAPASALTEGLPLAETNFRLAYPHAAACDDGAVWFVWWQMPIWGGPGGGEYGLFVRLVDGRGKDMLRKMHLEIPGVAEVYTRGPRPCPYLCQATPDGSLLLLMQQDLSKRPATVAAIVSRRGTVRTAVIPCFVPTGGELRLDEFRTMRRGVHVHWRDGELCDVFLESFAGPARHVQLSASTRGMRVLLLRELNDPPREGEGFRVTPPHLRWTMDDDEHVALAEGRGDTLNVFAADAVFIEDSTSWGLERCEGMRMYRLLLPDLDLLDSAAVLGSDSLGVFLADARISSAVALCTADGFELAFPSERGTMRYSLTADGRTARPMEGGAMRLPGRDGFRAGLQLVDFVRPSSDINAWQLRWYGLDTGGALHHERVQFLPRPKPYGAGW